MRLLAGALVVLALVACASATVPIYSKGSLGKGKFGKSSCAAPIGRVACRIDPKGNLQSVFYGHYSNVVTGYPDHVPYMGPVKGVYYTQNHCGAFGYFGACEAFNAEPLIGSGGNFDFKTTQIDFGGSTASLVTGSTLDPSISGQTLRVTQPVVSGMSICWGKKGIKGIQFQSTVYDTFWAFQTGKEPVPMWQNPVTGPAGACGQVDTCKAVTNYTAPVGKAIGGWDWKCKMSQDWIGYGQTGTYGSGGAAKIKYYVKDLEKVCLTDVIPYPMSKFIPCDGGDPNTCTAVTGATTCPPDSDFWKHQCPCNNPFAKKK